MMCPSSGRMSPRSSPTVLFNKEEGNPIVDTVEEEYCDK
tara:strand:- start:5346 stop:5462 length:117 start_codon:yes stop_codon:yes gene_type:complete